MNLLVFRNKRYSGTWLSLAVRWAYRYHADYLNPEITSYTLGGV
jgi:hypothetical protein